MAREWILVTEEHRGCSFRDQSLEVALSFSGRSPGSQEQELEYGSSSRKSVSLSVTPPPSPQSSMKIPLLPS